MLRTKMPARLDEVVSRSRIILIEGLPRVGRTELVRRWQRGRGDIALDRSDTNDDEIASPTIVDHLGTDDVDDFVRRFRASQEAMEDSRFVVIPVNLTAATKLHDALAGSIETVSLMPLQLGDVIAEVRTFSMPAGPLPDLTAEPVPTNAPSFDPRRHWLRGGFPQSLTAETDEDSLAWRHAMIDSLLTRDYSLWQVPRASRLPDVLRWIANKNGEELDETSCPFLKRAELLSALHVLDRLGIVRSMSNYPAGSNKSLGKKRKVFICDSGILHAMLGIVTVEQLERHPLVGASWESYAVGALIAAGAGRCTAQFYRANNDEIDLVLDFEPFRSRLVAIEFKLKSGRPPRPGFYSGCKAIAATDCFIVHSGPTPIRDNVDHLDILTALRYVEQIVGGR